MSNERALNWDCEQCQADGLAEDRGCIPGRDASIEYSTAAGPMKICPKRWVKENGGEANTRLRQYARAQDGFLPDAGGFEDQDPRFVEAHDLISAIVAGERRRAREEREQRGKGEGLKR